ncbi:MAG TPA: 4-alpha-glucanotransferase, partial [Bacteroidales bacterium]|nr:4-alpha-glucanotransferase [Bacteroidales bacterium]
MVVCFQIEYKTHPGQQLVVAGSVKELGGGNPANAPFMTLKDVKSGIWKLEVDIEKAKEFHYRYFVKDDNFGTYLEEWGPDRTLVIAKRPGNLILLSDRWRSASDPEYALHSSAFLNAILKPGKSFDTPLAVADDKQKSVVVRFKPNVVRVIPGHRVAVSGNAKSLGKWKENKALALGNPEHPLWFGEAVVQVNEFPLKYKYLIQYEDGKTAFWEKTGDRVLRLPEGELPDIIEIGDEKFDFPQYPWKGAGVAVPVFALRRKNGFGVGEFTDLKLLVDWAVKVGIKLIQILPVNDTVARHTWQDSYPYAAISVYAMHPMYINLLEIGKLNSETSQQIIDAQGHYLNSLKKIDYEAVMALKSRFFKLIYDQQKSEFLKDPDFLEFFTGNEYWLRPYAAFSYLRDLFNTPDFGRWGEYSKPTEELLEHLTNEQSPHFDDIAVHYLIQYYAHRQLLDAANYARSKGVVLKGDIPIGIFRNSVDA